MASLTASSFTVLQLFTIWCISKLFSILSLHLLQLLLQLRHGRPALLLILLCKSLMGRQYYFPTTGRVNAWMSALMNSWSASYFAWLSFCFRLSSSAFLAFSAFCSSTSFLCACTRRSRLRTNATSCRTSSLRSFRAFSLVFLFSFSMALFSQRLEACLVSYSSFQAKFLRVQKLCQKP